MIAAIRTRLSYANVVATIALFLILGGAAYAAKALPKNSVKSKSIKKNAVKEAKIADGAVTEPKLADGAVTDAKLSSTLLTNAIKVTRVNGPVITVPDSGARSGTTTCPAGTQAIGGQVAQISPDPDNSDMGLISSHRVAGNSRQWLIRMGNEDDLPRSFQLGAICISGVG